MKFGACCDIDKLPLLQKYGYHYIEMNFSNIALAEEEEFERIYEQIGQYEIFAESYNGFFRPDVNLNTNIDYDAIKKYAEKGFARAYKLGGKVAVLGSGTARRIPDGYDRNTATEQFTKVLNICGEVAAKYSMQIAIEPLRYSETNFINTVAEGIDICRLAGNEHVKCLVDFFHVYMNGESLDAIQNSDNMIIHTHIARPNADRRIPTIVDREICSQWANALKSIGYNGRISLEGSYYPDFETALQTVQPILDLFR